MGFLSVNQDSLLSDIFDSISDGVYVVDLNYRIVQANRTANEAYGPEPLVGQICYERFENRDSPCEFCPLAKTLRDGLRNFSEHVNLKGQHLELTCFPVKNRETGEIIAGTMFCKNVDAQKKQAEDLKSKEAVLTNIFACIQDSFYVIDPEYNVLYVNPRMEAIFPEHHPIVGKKCYTLVSNTEVCEGCPVPLALKNGTAEMQSKVHFYPHEPGEPWKQGYSGEWRELLVYPILDPETGKITSFFNFVRDITAQKLAEAALEHFRSHISVIADIRKSYYDSTEEECILSFLESVSKHFHIDDSWFVELENGKPVRSFFHERATGTTLRDTVAESFQTALPGEEKLHPSLWQAIEHLKIRHYRQGEPGFPANHDATSDGAAKIRSTLVVPCFRVGSVSRGLVFYSQRTAFFDDTIVSYLESCARELTRIIEESNNWRNHKLRLEQAREKAESATIIKSRFLANMSHEIRTPMTAILGYSDLVLNDYLFPLHRILRRPEFQKERREGWDELENLVTQGENGMKVILANGQFLLAMINDILDFSKADIGKMNLEIRPVNLLTLLEEIHSLYAIEADKKGITFSIVSSGNAPNTIDSDYVRLKQILVNLVGNAIKFTSAGRVELSVSWKAKTKERGALILIVRDTGIGMTPEALDKVFQPFQQADASTTRRFGGTGLGLAISKRLLDVMDAKIDVSSIVGQGTTFTIHLPLKWKSGDGVMPSGDLDTFFRHIVPDTIQEGASERSKQALRNVRILLAEDGLDNRRLISTLLRKAGAEVCEVENGEDAVETAMDELAAQKPFNVILMDMQMPVMDGYTATELLRKRGYEGMIVALTAHAMREDRQKCLDIGCNDYLTKPISRAGLVRCVSNAMKSEQ